MSRASGPPGGSELLAAGRDSDIFSYGPGLVLRRSRSGHSMESEARIMEYARSHGYPVPAVDQVREGGTELIMQRVDGPLMIAAMSRRPWTVGRHGLLLAQLHQRLHRIRAPEWLPSAPAGEGDRLLHFDLHPLNVILSTAGPVVIDWPNACRGDSSADIALTWLLLASGDNPANRLKALVTDRFRSQLVAAFLAPFDRDRIRAVVPAVAAWKMADPNMSDEEVASMQAFAHQRR